MRLRLSLILLSSLGDFAYGSSFEIPPYKPDRYTSDEYEKYLESIQGMVEDHARAAKAAASGAPVHPPEDRPLSPVKPPYEDGGYVLPDSDEDEHLDPMSEHERLSRIQNSAVTVIGNLERLGFKANDIKAALKKIGSGADIDHWMTLVHH